MKIIKRFIYSIFLCMLLTLTVFAEDGFAKSLTEKCIRDKGVCVIISNSVNLPVEISENSKFTVFARFTDKKAFKSAQKIAFDKGVLNKKVYITFGKITPIPVADNYADILVVEKSANITDIEIQRATCPNGVSIIIDGKKIISQKTQGLLKGASDWKNWWGTAGNNPVSEDSALKWPYLSQFFASPYRGSQPCMNFAYQGLLFSLVGPGGHRDDLALYKGDFYSKLKCLNGYNGTLIWEHKLPKDYLVLRAAATFSGNSLFLLNEANSILELDIQTGKIINDIKINKIKGQFKWMVVENEILYLMAGETDDKVIPERKYIGEQFGKSAITYGMGTQITAYDIKTKKTLWVYDNKEKMDSRMMTFGEEKIYFLAYDSYVGAIDAKTGAFSWKNDSKELKKMLFPKKKKFTHILRRFDSIALYASGIFLVGNYGMNNYVALDSKTGELRWTYSHPRGKKGTKPAFAAFVGGKFLIGGASFDPKTGKSLNGKYGVSSRRACSRETYSPEGAYGSAGRGYDMKSKSLVLDSGLKSGCQTGSVPGNGILYLSPHLCTCNLSIRGYVAQASAGGHDFSKKADASALEFVSKETAKLKVDEKDWNIYRGNNNRTSSTPVTIKHTVSKDQTYAPKNNFSPTATVSAGEFIFIAGRDGSVRCVNEKDASLKWISFTEGRIMIAPTIYDGAVYVGSTDGYIYSFNALTGSLLWRFHATENDRWIRNHKDLTNTWGVNTGIIIQDGILYAASGIMDWDKTSVYAIEAKTGKLKWCNIESAFSFDKRNNVGISPHGIMTIAKNKLWLSGGTSGSPASYDLQTGKFTPPERNGIFAIHGMDIGVLGNSLVLSGSFLHAPVNERRTDRGLLISFLRIDETGKRVYPEISETRKSQRGIFMSPAWDDKSIVFPKSSGGDIVLGDISQLTKTITATEVSINKKRRGKNAKNFKHRITNKKTVTPLWSVKGEIYDVILAENAIVAISTNAKYPGVLSSKWALKIYDRATGKETTSLSLASEPLMNGMSITRNGTIVIPLINGSIITYK